MDGAGIIWLAVSPCAYPHNKHFAKSILSMDMFELFFGASLATLFKTHTIPNNVKKSNLVLGSFTKFLIVLIFSRSVSSFR